MSQKRDYATKQEGSTKVDPFWNYADIKGMMDWFISHEQYENYLIFMFGLLMGRRIGDTLSIKWENLYYRNGKLREQLYIKEQKTGKTSEVFISPMMEQVINFYIQVMNIKPIDNYEKFVFENNGKKEWTERKNAEFYKRETNDIETINEWALWLGKDKGEKRKENILEEFNKQLKTKNKRKKVYNKLTDYLYNYVEYMDIIKSQQDVYRKQLVLAAKEIGLKYPVSTHSTRKTFGRITKMIHPNDIYCMQTLQDMFEHASEEQTRDYIGISKEKKKEFYNDIGEVICRVANGEKDILIDNSPIVSLSHEDLRKVLIYCIQCKNDEMNVFNEAMNMVDRLKIKNI